MPPRPAIIRQALRNHCTAFCPNVFGAAAGAAALGACDELAEAGDVFVGVVSDMIVSPLICCLALPSHHASRNLGHSRGSLQIGGGPAEFPPSPLQISAGL